MVDVYGLGARALKDLPLQPCSSSPWDDAVVLRCSAHLTGTVDLTAATGDVSDPATIAAAGVAAKAAPFLVRLDEQGRISNLSYNVPGTKTVFDVQYTNYGAPSMIEPPDASTVIPMPDKVYPALNS